MKIKLFKLNEVFIICVILSVCTSACHSYYKTSAADDQSNNKAGNIDSLQSEGRYFVLRTGDKAYHLKGIKLSADQKSFEATLEALSSDHGLHLTKGVNGRMRYQPRFPNLSVLNEVHLYSSTPLGTNKIGSLVNVDLDKIEKIEVIEKDKGRTTSSYVIGAIGYTVGAVAIAGVIIALTKSSCPFVSAYYDGQYSLQGEIYGGAIYPQLARHDYMPLKISPAKNSLSVKISNELQELQFTDIANLQVVSHSKTSKILSDQSGNLYSISDPQLPASAILNSNRDVLSAIKRSSDNELLYLDDSTSENAVNSVVLKFNKPPGQQKGKLLLTLKNSYWLDFLYGEIAKGFGNYYNTYLQQQQKKSAEELNKWTKEQQIPLHISIKTSTGWKDITDLNMIGPLATRETVVPIALTEINEENIYIKLSTGFMFWELDYIGMDFSVNEKFTVKELQPVSAISESGKSVRSELMNEDGIYLEQPAPGCVATINYRYETEKDPSKTQTYFLHTKGYYQHVRNYKHKPDFLFLKQFKQPNAFNKFSLIHYKKLHGDFIKTLANN